MLPKTLSDSLIRKLNAACASFVDVCDKDWDCDSLGWCQTCWILAGSDRDVPEPPDRFQGIHGDEPGAGKIANNANRD